MKVAAVLKVDDTLVKGYLVNCKIGLRGANAIADALKHNKKVWYLTLGYNKIGDQGADAIIDALALNVRITELRIYGNNIAPESIATIEYLTETRNKNLIPTTCDAR